MQCEVSWLEATSIYIISKQSKLTCMASQRKRKIEDENRTFQVEWEKLYFFTQVKDKAVCLICRQSFNTLKTYNLKRHHEQKHDAIAKLNDSA